MNLGDGSFTVVRSQAYRKITKKDAIWDISNYYVSLAALAEQRRLVVPSVRIEKGIYFPKTKGCTNIAALWRRKT